MLPRTLKDFLVYYWRFDPKGWVLFVAQDIVHYTRYPLAFLLVGHCVDILSRSPPREGGPGGFLGEQAFIS